MILKERSEPPEIFQLTSLLQRIPAHHSSFPQWTEKLRRITAGYHGEQRVDSLWHDFTIDCPHYFIHDLFIQKPQSSHQIDTVLVTSRFVLLLEIKSIVGLLNFDSQLRQFSRTNKDGSIEGMRNPDDQLRRHEKWLQGFLAEHNCPLPVIGAIVFTYPSSIVQKKADKRLTIQSSGLPFLLDQLLAVHKKDLLTKEMTFEIANSLVSLHSNKSLRWPLLPSTFQTGVLCPECTGVKMIYVQRRWRCENCSYSHPHAHLEALAQYRVLVSPTITNRQFRDFTGLSAPSTASKLLRNLAMPFRGSFKDRVYEIPAEIGRTERISERKDSI
ncbi:nuclease-related domain-containing protein [Planococcus salinus]|uniref:NERD domain-containing protein n=1 Tax=Planococcus salinus TaxID=1848460 RepID=A0A3M8P8Q8_9BACL|nr:nuclease-related domain-containing protein [Planococcus salinus]RNF40089.1 NERD domain-containing protein [Planococcus salinus]